MSLDTIYNDYKNKLALKLSTPEWITSVSKTPLSRNITIDDWNDVVKDIHHIASDCYTIDEFLTNYKTYVENKFSEYVTGNTLNTVLSNLRLDKVSNSELETRLDTLVSDLNEMYATYAYVNSLVSNVKLEMTSDYKLRVVVTFSNGTSITSQEIDLPLESMIVDGSYSDGILTLTLRNRDDDSIGESININISDIVSGLINTTDVQQAINDSEKPVSSYAVKQALSQKSQVNFTGNFRSMVEELIGTITYAPNFEDYYHRGDFFFLQSAEEPDFIILDTTGGVIDDSIIEIPTVDDIPSSADESGKMYKIANKITVATLDVGVLSNYEKKTRYTSLTDIMDGELLLQDNTVYIANSTISMLKLSFPTGNFCCSLKFTISSNKFTIVFPENTQYVGTKPNFQSGETWEVNIMNGIVAAGKVVSEE